MLRERWPLFALVAFEAAPLRVWATGKKAGKRGKKGTLYSSTLFTGKIS